MSGRPSRAVVASFLFIALVGYFAWRLVRPSGPPAFEQTVSRPMPTLDLAAGRTGQAPLTTTSFATGKPQLLNLFASWCVPCIAEAPHLMTLRREGVPIRGIAIRDRPEAVTAFLARHGDPFAAIGLDPDSRAQRALGAAGVPETFVVDGQGTMVRRFIGGLGPDMLDEVRQALAEAATATPVFQSHEEERHALFGAFTPAERWLILADSYARTGDRKGAIDAIRAGLRARPDDAELWTGLGTALVEQAVRLTPEARAAFAKAVEIAPDSPGPGYFLGLAMLRSGDRAGAVAEWKRLLADVPAASWRPMVERQITLIAAP